MFTISVQDGWSRRALLGAVGGAGVATVLAGCGILNEEPTAAPEPLEPLLDSARLLAARHEAAAAAYPELAQRLDPLLAAHQAHQTALLRLIGRPEPTPTASTSAVWSPPVDTAATAEEAVVELREAERAGADEAAQACLAAPPERTSLLGSIAAARATHVEVLT